MSDLYTALLVSAQATPLSIFGSLCFGPLKLASPRVGIAFLASAVLATAVFLALVLTKPLAILRQVLAAVTLVISAGMVFFLTESLLTFFVAFELLLLASLYLLRLTSKSERVIDASTEMFFWTLFGSAALLVAFSWLYVQA